MVWLTYAGGDPYGPMNKPFRDPGRDVPDPSEDEEPVEERPWTGWAMASPEHWGGDW